jgi:hypothetical protein
VKYLQDGNRWHPLADAALPMHGALPPGYYAVAFNKQTEQYFLEEVEPFKLPSKLYGRIGEYAERILTTFHENENQTGVLLSGLKGSGKTLLSKVLGAKAGVPVILVNTGFHDDKFLRLIQGIPQRAVVIFDEFEKIYKDEDQKAVLTLFDGVYTARNKLIVLTVNERRSVSVFFHNRPGRLRYAIDFKGLEADFIREYCDDHLRAPSVTAKQIVEFSTLCMEFNFDMLQVLVAELNRYGGTLDEATQILNVKALGMDKAVWMATVEVPSEPKLVVEVKGEFRASPMASMGAAYSNGALDVDFKLGGTLANGLDVEGDVEVNLRLADLVKVDAYKETYTFRTQLYQHPEGEIVDYKTEKTIPAYVTFSRVDTTTAPSFGYSERYAC